MKLCLSKELNLWIRFHRCLFSDLFRFLLSSLWNLKSNHEEEMSGDEKEMQFCLCVHVWSSTLWKQANKHENYPIEQVSNYFFRFIFSRTVEGDEIDDSFMTFDSSDFPNSFALYLFDSKMCESRTEWNAQDGVQFQLEMSIKPP